MKRSNSGCFACFGGGLDLEELEAGKWDEATHSRVQAGNMPAQPAWKSLKAGDVKPMAEVLPGIFLGSVHAAADHAQLKSRGITHILNLAGKSAYASDLILFGEPIQNVKDEQSFRYRDKNIPDLASSNLKNMFPETTAFIRSVLASGGKVLVHCMMGVSRSTSTLIAYMIDTEGFTYDAAFSRIKSVRQAAQPNDGFTSQLRSYEKKYRSQDGVGRASEAATNASSALSILADKANYASV